MKILTRIFIFLCAGFVLATSLGACSSRYPLMQKEVAQRIAAPAWMVQRGIDTGAFTLTAYERMHERNAAANIYIEGNADETSTTPMNPVALHLASRDKAENVAWLGRPCQFSAIRKDGETCVEKFWKGNEYTADILMGYKNALENIKRTYNITEFNLIGYNGGAAIAALLAAERDDVASLRTVAGVLNPAITAENALSPVSYGHLLKDTPQIHFLGDMDNTTSLADINTYMQALGSERCTTYEIVENASHKEGWVNKWPELLLKMPECSVPPPAPEPEGFPVDTSRPPAIYYPRDEESIK